MIATYTRICAVALALVSGSSIAAGLPSIIGVNADGYTVAADFESPPYSVEIWRESTNSTLREASAKRFDNEPCKFYEKTGRKDSRIRFFSCSAKAKSPLAGTKYRGHEVNGNCEGGDPEFSYVCIQGCDRNKKAPIIMDQAHWEC